MTARDESRLAVGIMTGTSIDGLDVALIRTCGIGLDLRVQVLQVLSHPLDDLADTLRSLASNEPRPASVFAAAAHDLGRRCARLIQQLDLPDPPQVVAVHGQTIHHAPPHSLQLLDPMPIAMALKCPVVFDLRGADLAAGGQGAPITPLADWILFRSVAPTAVINLGGFCNITHLPADDECRSPEQQRAAIQARDVCPCNHILDDAARQWLDMPFDLAGASACRGHVDDARAAAIADAIKSVAAGHRSLGSGDEGREILSHVASMSSADDRLATVVDGLARVIAGAIPDATRRVIVAGGGGHNRALMNAMSRHHQHTLTPSPEVGIELHAREPVAMAILGLLALDGVVVTLPQVTGRKVAISFDGSWCRPPPFK